MHTDLGVLLGVFFGTIPYTKKTHHTMCGVFVCVVCACSIVELLRVLNYTIGSSVRSCVYLVNDYT